MAVSHYTPGQPAGPERPERNDPLTLHPQDCQRGHACQFCPQEETCTLDKSHHEGVLLQQRLSQIGHIVLVMANKGGVGKSTVTANTAIGLAQKGFRVGVADADIHGPNQSRFLGQVGQKVRLTPQGLESPDCFADQLLHPLKVGSLGFLMDRDDNPIVWRDAYKHDFMHHLIGSFDWGELDFLLIDMPPGTGNELITLSDLLEEQNVSVLIATTPQQVALMDSLKAVRFCQERGMPILGVVENMAGVHCPNCGEDFHLFPRAHLDEALAELNVCSIAQIPLSPLLASASDTGAALLLDHPDSPEAVAFQPVVEACLHYAEQTEREAATAAIVHLTEHASDEVHQALSSLSEDERAEVEAQLSQLLGGASGTGGQK